MAFWYLWWVKSPMPGARQEAEVALASCVSHRSAASKAPAPIIVTKRPAKLTGVSSSPNAHEAIEMVVTSLKTPATLSGTTPARWMMLVVAGAGGQRSARMCQKGGTH